MNCRQLLISDTPDIDTSAFYLLSEMGEIFTKNDGLGIQLKIHSLCRGAIVFIIIRNDGFFRFCSIVFSYISRSNIVFFKLFSLRSFLKQTMVTNLLILYIINQKNCNVYSNIYQLKHHFIIYLLSILVDYHCI